MLVKDATDHNIDRQKLDTPLERQLVALERLACGAALFRITEDGELLLSAVRRIN